MLYYNIWHKATEIPFKACNRMNTDKAFGARRFAPLTMMFTLYWSRTEPEDLASVLTEGLLGPDN